MYLYKAKYDKALNTYLRILDSSDPTKNKQEYRVALNNVGLVYFKLDDLDKALTYFNNALALMDDPADEVEIQLVLMNMGLCHVYKDNYTLAEEYTNRAFSYCNDGSCSLLLRGKLYFNMGLIAQGRKQWTLAEEYYLRSHQMVKETGDELYEVDNLIRLFQIYIETNNIAAAKSHLREAEAILSGHTYYVKGIMELYAELAKVYQRLGNIHQVATYQAKYITLRDSVYNEGLTKNLMKVEAEYLERENRHKLEAQAKILELSNDVITRQRAVNIFIGIVAVLSFAIALVLTQNVKQKRHANELLEQKVKERTTQLEANHLNLLKSLEERNQQVKRIASEIRSSMATIKGLCQLSLQDGSVIERGQYITKIETASNMLESGIYRTLGVSESTES